MRPSEKRMGHYGKSATAATPFSTTFRTSTESCKLSRELAMNCCFRKTTVPASFLRRDNVPDPRTGGGRVGESEWIPFLEDGKEAASVPSSRARRNYSSGRTRSPLDQPNFLPEFSKTNAPDLTPFRRSHALLVLFRGRKSIESNKEENKS